MTSGPHEALSGKARLAVAQMGAPTAVVNASLWGFLEGAGSCDVLGVFGGPAGLLRDDLRPLHRSSEHGGAHHGPLAAVVGPSVAGDPGAWLGAGRHPFAEADLDAVVDRLVARRVDGLALIGGNGTMFLANELHRRALGRDLALCVVGVPKTVDNDLTGTDHAPGFPSAARFLAQTVRALALDLRAMTSIEEVRFVETLGRNSGWLALATLLARADAGGAPHLVYVPERPFDEGSFLGDVRDAVDRHGAALVVVAEGTAGPTDESPFDHPVFDRPVHGGVVSTMARLVEERLGFGTRTEVLGLIQRCASWAVSAVDRSEAQVLGAEGARLLRRGVSGVMVALPERHPGDPPAAAPTTVLLADVAGRTRPVPSHWVPTPEGGASEFVDWLRPLVGRLQESSDGEGRHRGAG
ncbi:MAG TPA: 6-phosphofructokinase [Acidimicrobiales bacterium]|nr:6-phosphofructokinase [Acidimicrobiales bacterium]